MRKSVFAVVFLAVAASTASGQVRSSSQGFWFNLHPNGSALKVEEANETETGGGLGAGLGYGLTGNIALFVNVDGAAMSSDGGDYKLGHADVGVRYTFMSPAARLRPSLDASVGGRLLRADDVDFEELGTADIEMSGRTMNVGGGVAYWVSPSLAVDAGVRWSFGKFSKLKVDDVTIDLEGDERVSATSSRLNLGLSWFPRGGRRPGYGLQR